MEQKSNYKKNKDEQKQRRIILIIAFIILFLIVLISSFKKSTRPKNNTQSNVLVNNKAYFSVDDYKSLEELLSSKYNCKVQSKNETSELLTVNLTFGENLYNGDTSNERYFMNLCKSVAKYINYKNFRLIDSNKDIDIEVKCEEPNINEVKINGDENYFQNKNSEINSKNSEEKITKFIIQSNELQSLIDGGWVESTINFGTLDSTCDGYKIYFDEGIKYNVVSKNIYNVIFTRNYKGEVAGGLTPNSNKEEVISKLGNPTFDDGANICGYLGEKNYLFFDFSSKEISVYPRAIITNEDEEMLKKLINEMNDSGNVKKFVTDLTAKWADYDKYDFNESYVDLVYSLKGVELKVSDDSFDNGVFIYKNYSGNKNFSEIKNIYIKSDDSVFLVEKERVINDQLNRSIEGDFTDDELKEMGKDFALIYKYSNENGVRGAKFYSRDYEYADSELGNTTEVSSSKWYDDSKLVYSVNDDGIYLYDCITRKIAKIIDLEGKIIINSAGDNKIIYNENEVINVDIR